MNLHTLLLFIPACFALNLLPGANNLLAMSNGNQFGVRYAVTASAGRVLGFTILITLTSMGLSAIIYTSPLLFNGVKLAGALYLFWISYQLWHSETKTVSADTTLNTFSQRARQEFLLSISNPKALLIFVAFFPQYINTEHNIALQFIILGMFFVSFEVIACSIYASTGAFMRKLLTVPKNRKRFNRLCAVLVGLLGIELLLSNLINHHF
ncbi:lysine transporter LysE [Shewanella sp. OPT22]|nr:lysine transporter LysE [Shewanella sp. OPT22]